MSQYNLSAQGFWSVPLLMFFQTQQAGTLTCDIIVAVCGKTIAKDPFMLLYSLLAAIYHPILGYPDPPPVLALARSRLIPSLIVGLCNNTMAIQGWTVEAPAPLPLCPVFCI